MSRVLALALLTAAVVSACSRDDRAPAAADAAALARLQGLDAQLTTLEADVSGMATYNAIWANELKYTRGLDRHDSTLSHDVFWPQASISYGTPVAVEELAPWANASHANSAAHQHHVTGLTLDIDGDTAYEEGYILYSSDMPRDKSLDTQGVPTPGRALANARATLGTGRYVNRYERRNGKWRMIVHEYVHDISMPLEAVDLCATACLGRWDKSDISYLRPLEPLTVEQRSDRASASRQPHADKTTGSSR